MLTETKDKNYIIKKFEVGPIETNCYAVMDKITKKIAIVDPGYYSQEILNWIYEEKAAVEMVILTHGHFDHILGLDMFSDVLVYINEHDEEMLTDPEKNAGFMINQKDFKKPKNLKTISDGSLINFSKSQFKTIHTKGHTKGSCCFIFNEEYLFSGDTIFKGSIGRSDLYGADPNQIKNSVRKILNLDKNYIILPGHGNTSTIMFEKNNNPYSLT